MNEETQTFISLDEADRKKVFMSPEDVIVQEELGCGQSGRVFKGILKKDIGGLKIQKTIAVKEIRIKYRDTLFDVNNKIKEETIRFKNVIHPNVITTIGICEKELKTTLILMEYAIGGSLYNLLQDSRIVVTKEILLNWSLQIARGLEIIHANELLHCDLKSKNILMSFYPCDQEQMMNVVLKISNISHFSSSGTPTHMAPESMKRRVTRASDIWSFGVVLWEILTRKKPFAGLEPLQILYKVGVKRQTLELNGDYDPGIIKLIKKCWIYDHLERPDISKVIEELLRIQKGYKTN